MDKVFIESLEIDALIGIYDCVEGFKGDNSEPQLKETMLRSIQSLYGHKTVYNISVKIETNITEGNDTENLLYKEAVLAFDRRGYVFGFEYKSFDGKWRSVEGGDVKGGFEMEVLRRDYEDGLVERVVDVEDHLDRVEADFLNLVFNN